MNATALTSNKALTTTFLGFLVVTLFLALGVLTGNLIAPTTVAHADAPTTPPCTATICDGATGSIGNLPTPLGSGTGGAGNR